MGCDELFPLRNPGAVWLEDMLDWYDSRAAWRRTGVEDAIACGPLSVDRALNLG